MKRHVPGQKLWFRRAPIWKRGWIPCSWEGWLAVLLYAAVLMIPALTESTILLDPIGHIFYVFVVSAIFLVICYQRGETL